ncbi:MAG: hypothetical protein ACRCY9_15335 [Phycicoccus sp.]
MTDDTTAARAERLQAWADRHARPTFEDIRRRAYAMLGDTEDELRSDWRATGAPTPAQNNARIEALEHIARAKAALNRAA